MPWCNGKEMQVVGRNHIAKNLGFYYIFFPAGNAFVVMCVKMEIFVKICLREHTT